MKKVMFIIGSTEHKNEWKKIIEFLCSKIDLQEFEFIFPESFVSYQDMAKEAMNVTMNNGLVLVESNLHWHWGSEFRAENLLNGLIQLGFRESVAAIAVGHESNFWYAFHMESANTWGEWTAAQLLSFVLDGPKKYSPDSHAWLWRDAIRCAEEIVGYAKWNTNYNLQEAECEVLVLKEKEVKIQSLIENLFDK